MIKRFLKWLNEPAREARELRVNTIKFVNIGTDSKNRPMFSKELHVNGQMSTYELWQTNIEITKSDIEFLMESEA